MMRAVTLTQPWAGLVASGIKRIENRPRPIIKREHFGKPFALHASREIDEATYETIANIAPDLAPESNCLMPPWRRLSRITSAVIAVTAVERAVINIGIPCRSNEKIVDLYTREPVDLGDQHRWFFGTVGYVMRDVRALATPVPCRGMLGFWTLPDDVECAVVEQLGAAP